MLLLPLAGALQPRSHSNKRTRAPRRGHLFLHLLSTSLSPSFIYHREVAIIQHLLDCRCCFAILALRSLTTMLRLPTNLLAVATCLFAFVSSHTVITYPGQRGNNLHTFGNVSDTNGLGETTLGKNKTNPYGQYPYGMQWMYPCMKSTFVQ